MTPKERAWSRQVEQNEGWDGERGIRAAAKRRFDAEWRENGPTIVALVDYSTTEPQRRRIEHEFPTRREAEAFADKQPASIFTFVRAKEPVAR